jgi:Xaa-Pro aminopeptidase
MEAKERIERLQARLTADGCDGYLITQNIDLYYLTGSMQTGYLFVPAKGEPVYYVRRSVARAAQESAVRTEPLGSLRQFGDRLAADFPELWANRQPIIATEYDVLPVQQFNRLKQAIPSAEWRDGSVMMRELRMIKTADEIALIRHSGQLIGEALDHVLGLVKVGMTDLELTTEVEYYVRRRGHMGIMRMRGYNQEIITGMIGSGWAAAMPTYFDGPAGGQGLGPASPQGAGTKPIARNEPILIDIGCCVNGYVIDQTRTAVIGRLSDELHTAYEVSERILRQTESALRPGTVCETLYTEAVQTAREAGLAEHFMGYGDDQVKFLGHGIGLEVDEWPVLARGFQYQLQPGMVIAIEPKFTYPGQGVVGIENTYHITEHGWENLTPFREGVIEL